MADRRIRVLCVDDHRIVREGLEMILSASDDIEVVGSVPSGEEALRFLAASKPDVVLLDLRLPGINGIETTERLHSICPRIRIVILTMHDGDEDIYRALAAGASTYLLKTVESGRLLETIRDVHAGNKPVDPRIAAKLEERDARPKLTRREVQVLELITGGYRNKEIATHLKISEETVQTYVKTILIKLNVEDRGAAARMAIRRGIVHD
jgi:two-component system, NarL family, response regulator